MVSSSLGRSSTRSIVFQKSLLATAISALAVSPCGWAQPIASPDNEPMALQELVVKGELIETKVQDNETSVSVVRGEELERRSDTDLYDVIERTPNASVSNGRQGFAIRGIDQRGVGGGGSGQVISIQVDGIALPSNQSTFFGPYSNWDVEQIEVLRGPQSTQQGRNALAGAIVVRTQDPSYEQELKIRAESASRDTGRGAVAFNLPLVDDTLAFRFAAERFETDGWIDNPTRNDDAHDEQKMDSARAKLRWDPRDDVNVVLSHSYTHNRGGEDLFSEENWPEERLIFSNVDEEEGSRHRISGLRTIWDINNTYSLDVETTYYQSDYVRVEDNDSSAADLGRFDREGTSQAFEQDVRLQFNTANTRGVVGLFYSNNESDNPTLQSADLSTINGLLVSQGLPGFPVGVGTFDRQFSFGNESENMAAFGEAEFDIASVPGLTVTTGLRYDREEVTEKRTATTTTDPAPGALPPPFNQIAPAIIPADTDIRSSASFDAWLPKLGVTYDWNPDLATSFTVQRGYRAGGTYTNQQTGETGSFDPEYVWNYELAVRAEHLDGRVTTNANLFYLDWSDQQVNVEGPGGILDTDTVNAGESRVYGAELSATAFVGSSLDLFASVGYARSEFVDFQTDGNDLEGNSFPGAPEWTAAVGGEYWLTNQLTLAADASYTGSSYSDTENDEADKSDSRVLVNARVGYEVGNMLLGLYARNLFDKDYATYRGGTLTGNEVLIRAGEPRTVGAFVQLRL